MSAKLTRFQMACGTRVRCCFREGVQACVMCMRGWGCVREACR
jgi:hypothetical protein